jgi:hypothetical protein
MGKKYLCSEKSQPHSFAGTVLYVKDDTLSPDNGGVSGLDYSERSVDFFTRCSFRQATPGPIQRRRWYQARSLLPDSLNPALAFTIPNPSLSVSNCAYSITHRRRGVKLNVGQ